MTEPDLAARAAVAARAASVLRPAGALERLDEVAAWLAGWQRTTTPHVEHPLALVFAGDHGVVAEGVTAYPASITADVVDALRKGQATAAVMAARVGAAFEVVDVGVGRPTANLAVEPALSPERFAEAWQAGVDAVAGADADLVVVGEVGMGNTTPAAALAAAGCGGPAAEWVGRGAGIDDDALARKVDVVTRAVARVGAGCPPTELLRELGGSELAAVAGAVAEARRRSLPVLLDGFVTTAAVLPLWLEDGDALDHCLAAHVSPEPGHRRLLDRMGLAPLLDLGLRLGEGSGALAAVPLLQLAVAAVCEVATFEEWGLSR